MEVGWMLGLALAGAVVVAVLYFLATNEDEFRDTSPRPGPAGAQLVVDCSRCGRGQLWMAGPREVLAPQAGSIGVCPNCHTPGPTRLVAMGG